MFGQLYGARGICRRDYLLTAATGLWAHSAKATVAPNNKHNTIWHLTLDTRVLGWLQLEMAEKPVRSPLCCHIVSLAAV